jgi:hypothetical protein
MKRVSIVRGQTLTTFKPNHGFGYLPDAINAFVDQYKFVASPEPKTILPPDLNTVAPPAIFKHGKLQVGERIIVIDEVQVYQLGLIVTAQQRPTIDTDLIAEEITKWAARRFDLAFEALTPPIHSSSLEVEFEKPLPELFPHLSALSKAIQDGLGDFWETKPEYELVNLHFGFDPLKVSKTAPTVFRIERRAEMPFEKGLYYCEASMTTDAHIQAVELFERLSLESPR